MASRSRRRTGGRLRCRPIEAGLARRRDRPGGPACDISVGELDDFDGLVRGDVMEDLGRAARWPVDFEARDPVGVGQADVLLERVGAEAAARRDVPVNRQRLNARTRRDDVNAGTDGGPVGLLANELDREPVVALAGVLEQDVVRLVAVDHAAGLDEKVEIAVAIPVAAGDAVPFLKVAGARACR